MAAPILTERLELRDPVEGDRDRFFALFCDDDFMVFTGRLDDRAAHDRFDNMLLRASQIAFAKRPIVECSSARIVGYSGVDVFEFEGEDRLEFGYRLIPEARGRGYATEASLALLGVAATAFTGEILAMVDPTNIPSQRVIAKLGFEFWKQAVVNGFLDNLYRLRLG